MAKAQSSTGQITGIVTDSTGAVVPGASVSIVNTQTNVTRQAITNGDGVYVASQLQPGPYSIKVQSKGFNMTVVKVAALEVNQVLNQAVVLSPGAENQTVEVTASGELMQTASSEIGAVIDPQQVHDIPLNGRNFTELITLAPGIGPVSTGQAATIGTGPISTVGIPGSSFSQPSIQGQWNRMDYYTLDGAINVASISNSYVVLPMIDSIQEFKVQSHSDNAEFGSVLGGVVNVVTKSGTNNLHGTAFEYLRNSAFDASNPFTGLSTLHQNDFGGTVGGPVRIPKLYNGRDRTFFTFGYEGWRYSSNVGNTYLTVPTAAELGGDFSHSLITCTNSTTQQTFVCPIYDPTTVPRTQFNSNMILPSRIDPLTQKYLTTYYDAPNATVAGNPLENDLVKALLRNNNNTYNARIDEHAGTKDTVFFRYTRMNYQVSTPDTNKFTSDAVEHPVNYAVGYTHLFTANLLTDLHFGYSKLDYAQLDLPNAGVPSIQSVGLTSLIDPGYPSFSLAGYSGIAHGDSPGTLNRYNKNFSASANVSYSLGKHEIRGGFQFMYLGYANGTSGSTGTTVYGFQPQQTSDGTNFTLSGNALASALLSYPAQVSTSAQTFNLKYGVYAPYLQDTWKVTQKLTVNLGFRLDHFSSPTITDHGLLSEFDPDNGNWIIGSSKPLPQCIPAAAPCIPTGAAYATATGSPGLAVTAANHIQYLPLNQVTPQADWNYGPRIGIAYAVNPKLTVRGGFGIVSDTLSGILQTIQSNIGSWPDSSQSNVTYNPTSPTTVPTTTVETATKNQGLALPGPTPFNSGNWMYDPKLKNPYSEQWNLEVQQQLTKSSTLSIAYVGSTDHRLPVTGTFNVGTPGSGGVDRPYPYLGATEMAFSNGYSHFNALEAKLQGHFGNGLDLLASYTWQKTLDVTSGYFGAENDGPGPQQLSNLRGEYGPAGYNLKNILVVSALYDLPIGKGKAYLNHGIAAYTLGDWQLNTTTSARSGLPYTIAVDGDQAQVCPGGSCLFGTGYERANVVGNPRLAQRSRQEWFNTSAFAVPALGTYGNSGRDSFIGPGSVESDVSIFKLIPIKDRVHIQFRFEAFNFINKTNLALPNTDVSSPSSFGIITGTSTPPRELQFGARVEF